MLEIYMELNPSLCEPPYTRPVRTVVYSKFYFFFKGFRECKHLRGALRQFLAEPSTRLADVLYFLIMNIIYKVTHVTQKYNKNS